MAVTVDVWSLQWSRPQLRTETSIDMRALRGASEIASMEPSSVEDGNTIMILAEETHEVASMEPSSVEDGNLKLLAVVGYMCGLASMEPSSVEDGNARCTNSRVANPKCFNGAVLS